ncbi:hypothetical protein Xph01_54920 [Micromonospora phaseoli]|nr:hypothetical protein Xph01_54920 [Micromonospora phaseoli]
MLVVLALALGALVGVPASAMAGPAAVPEGCRNAGGGGYASCNGKDPQAMGCSSGATTTASGRAKNGVWVELRYSSGCQAYWTRYTNTPGSTGDARIWNGAGTVFYKKTLAAYAGETGWTPMMAANVNPDACLYFYYADLREWMEYCP